MSNILSENKISRKQTKLEPNLNQRFVLVRLYLFGATISMYFIGLEFGFVLCRWNLITEWHLFDLWSFMKLVFLCFFCDARHKVCNWKPLNVPESENIVFFSQSFQSLYYYLPLQSAGSSLLSEQSLNPSQYFDNGIQMPFGHINSDRLHVCFDFVIGILLILALFVFVRMLLPLLVDFSLCSLKSMPLEADGSCFDDDSGASAAANDDDIDEDDCGNDSASDRNVSKQMSAHSNAAIKQCPSIRNCNERAKKNEKSWLNLFCYRTTLIDSYFYTFLFYTCPNEITSHFIHSLYLDSQ